MIRLIVMACILITSTQASAANWIEVAANEEDTARYYVDTESIKRIGEYLYVTEMANYNNLVSASNKNWKSDISEMRFDCANTNSLSMAVKLYAENNGNGELVGNYKGGNEDDTKIIASDTIAAKIFDYVCQTKNY
jgi:hypothetical protein